MVMVEKRCLLKLLDLFCGAGGASMGYKQAGFDHIVGIDSKKQKRYPFHFIQADALEYLKKYGSCFDVIHASPPCQAYAATKVLHDTIHPEYIEELRELLVKVGKPYIIENVVGAPLRSPLMLCGTMFNLKVYRHRLFETSFSIEAPEHPPHTTRATSMGRGPRDAEFMTIVGHFSGVPQARLAMDIPWMVRDELAQAIPPAYAKYIGLAIFSSEVLSA